MFISLPRQFRRTFTWRLPWFCVPQSPEAYRYLEKIFLFLVALISFVKSSLRFAYISVCMVFSFLISFISDGHADLRKTVALLKPSTHLAGLRENCWGWRSQPLPVKLQPAIMANLPRIQEVFFWCAWRRDEKKTFRDIRFSNSSRLSSDYGAPIFSDQHIAAYLTGAKVVFHKNKIKFLIKISHKLLDFNNKFTSDDSVCQLLPRCRFLFAVALLIQSGEFLSPRALTHVELSVFYPILITERVI